jgi:chemotaxis signal transduction protein
VSEVHVRVRVGSERYAFPVGEVLEVAEVGDVTAVPGAPGGVVGVRNLRGQILPVIDLGQILGVVGDAGLRSLVVAEHGEYRAGLAVDELEDVGPLPEISEQSESPFLEGAMLVDGSLVGVVNVAAVLASASTLQDAT